MTDDKLSPEGIVVLDGALTWIEENPERHRQANWFTPGDCGTTMCLAGVITFLAGATPILVAEVWDQVLLPDGQERYVEDYAAELLGVGVESRVVDSLFYVSNDLGDLRYYRDQYVAVAKGA